MPHYQVAGRLFSSQQRSEPILVRIAFSISRKEFENIYLSLLHSNLRLAAMQLTLLDINNNWAASSSP